MAHKVCPTTHKAPPAPYYAVIFSSTLADDAEGYGAMAARMVELAREQDGFLGVESAARTSEGFGITVSYWRDLESIRKCYLFIYLFIYLRSTYVASLAY